MSPLPAVQSTSAPVTPPSSAETRLKKTAMQMEGLFVQRLFAAMRDTVPDDGLVAQNDGQSTFTSLLDEKLAEQVPSQWGNEHSLATALYDQLRRRLSPAETGTTPDSASGPTNPTSSKQ